MSPSPLLWVTLLSLDAPLVAVLWQLLFVESFGVRLGAGVTIVLGLTVWLIYVVDRFLDTLSAPAQGLEPIRHLFYRQRRWAFVLPFGAVFALTCWMAWTELSPKTFRHGLVILLAVGGYFFFVHLRKPEKGVWVPKEMIVGILFGLGTCFPVWEHIERGKIRLLAPFLVFTVLCWLNCAAIESAEWVRLRHQQLGSPHPWTIWLGRHMMLAPSAIALVATTVLLAGFENPAWQLAAAEILSAGAIALLDMRGDRVSLEKFRVLMDVALFTPVLFLPFGH